jgi:hypothetical protein
MWISLGKRALRTSRLAMARFTRSLSLLVFAGRAVRMFGLRWLSFDVGVWNLGGSHSTSTRP